MFFNSINIKIYIVIDRYLLREPLKELKLEQSEPRATLACLRVSLCSPTSSAVTQKAASPSVWGGMGKMWKKVTIREL